MKYELPKVIYGGPDEPQPDWRKEDPDTDDDEPAPFSDRLLHEMHGFDADTEDRKSRLIAKAKLRRGA